MDNFAFVIHPVDPKKDVARKFPLLGTYLPVAAIDFLSRYFPPVYVSHITGVRSQATGEEVEGWFVACPLTPGRSLALRPSVVYEKVIQTGRLAEKLGARLLGLGGFTSVVGDGGVTIAKGLSIPVTTGDSFTVATAVEATRLAAERMGINLGEATAAVVGASGTIGRVCAQLIARDVPRLLLIGRRPEPLVEVGDVVHGENGAELCLSTDMRDLRQADVVLTVTSAIGTVIEPEHLKPGAVVCDVARPRDVSRRVVEERDDVLVIDGGMVAVPGPVDFGFDFGFPPGMAFACMAETMVLALEGRYESYTLGKNISLAQVQGIADLAAKHGFGVGGFRCFEQPVTDEHIEQIKGKRRNVSSQYSMGKVSPLF
jgi:fatty aldehyde-generating acyl-ACP reductase